MITADPNTSIVFDNMVAEWGGTPYAQLAVLLVHLRFLAFIHQTHHWIARGDAFHGDHKMFEELYNSVLSEIDVVAERLVGLGSADGVNITLQTSQLMRLVSGYGMTSTIPQSSEFAKRSMVAERNFIKTGELAIEQMGELGTMTPGLENMLTGLLDIHERHMYKLKQRIS